MEIKIIDNSGVLNLISFEYNKKKKQFDYNKLIRFIKNCFNEQLKLISIIAPIKEGLFIEINLEQSSLEDNENQQKLASINIELSSNQHYVFYLYQPTLYAIIDSLENSEIFSQISYDFNETILHELVHATDLFTLKKIEEVKDKELRLNKFGHTKLFEITHPSQLNYDSSLHWFFLDTINVFRNEGVAILGETILHDNKRKLKYSEQEIITYFSNLVNTVQHKVIDLQFVTVIEKNSILEDLNEISLLAYSIGDYILLRILEKVYPEIEFIVQKTLNYIYRGKSESLNDLEKKRIFTYLFNFDLSDYVNALLGLFFEEINSSLLASENVFNYCSILQKETNTEGINLFALNLALTGKNKSHQNFIELMEKSVYSCMKLSEISESLQLFMDKNYDENIVKSIKHQAEILYEHASNNSNEIARWALTYLLDDEDLIYDKISIMGWQDDWLVLDAAINLLNSKSFN